MLTALQNILLFPKATKDVTEANETEALDVAFT